MSPPKNSADITVGEKPSIQAAERHNGCVRTRIGTIIRGKNSTCERHGTMTSLFAAADIKKRKARTKTYDRKRRVEFVKFMDYVVKSVPGASDPDNGIKLHVVL
ncbi:MAG: IS630 family transposase, partial [Deltaproteobacteria bacterium]|nr:IS630 family transposase [Deltaproteobacteria bacterium]